MFRTLRQPRYAAFSALMVFLALVCVVAGSWQIARFDGKIDTNGALRRNAEAAPVTLGNVLPLVPGTVRTDDVRLRRVTVTGTYDATDQSLVRRRQVQDTNGYYVMTPLHLSDGAILLVARGFVTTTVAAAPPTGTVTVTGRVEAGDTADDKAAELAALGQLETINPVQQATRLGAPVYAGYVELTAGAPGTAGLIAIPNPDLSNPAGGAVEPQHFAYIIQWYLFAALALAAPLVMARAESRRDPGELDQQRSAPDPAADLSPEDRADRLADRYGRPVSRRAAR